MAQDLARGKRTEIDHLNGYVVKLGQVLGVPTPVNRSLQVLVKLLERRGQEEDAIHCGAKHSESNQDIPPARCAVRDEEDD